MKHRALRFRYAFFLSGVALGLYGLVRFVFAMVGVRAFGPEYLADTAPNYALVMILATLVSAVPGVVVSKFVPELLAGEKREEAALLFSAMFTVVVIGAIGCGLGYMVLGPARFTGEFVALSLCFPIYAMFKLTYLAFGASQKYAGAELLSCVIFLVSFGAACASDRPTLATASLVIHPTAFVLVATVHHRGLFRRAGVTAHLRTRAREYLPFAGFTLVNAATGMGGTPLVLALAGTIVPDRRTVGYLSALLIGITPLNLIPAALGSALFPEVARRHGLGDTNGVRRLVWRTTALLQVTTGTVLGIFAVFPEVALASLGVPSSSEYAATWCIIAAGMFVSASGLPSGMFLNATTAVGLNATIGFVWLAAAVLTGLPVMRMLGVAGAGVMFFLATGPAGWWRMAAASRKVQWLAVCTGPLILSHVGVVLALGFGAAHSFRSLAAIVLCALVGSQIPLLIASSRAAIAPIEAGVDEEARVCGE